jgi:hypothetical protein
MNFRARVLGKAVLILAAAALLGLVVMVLWNSVVTRALTGARPLDYLQALGLFVLTRILFGGLRGHLGGHRRRHWEKWQAMTPEERESFRERLHSRGSASGRE